MMHSLALRIQPQPTETSCGPTCLAAVYEYWDRPLPLDELIDQIGELDQGGTLAVHLGCDALRRGFSAEITTYNLQLFDPTWFDADGKMRSSDDLLTKLIEQQTAKGKRSDIDQSRLRTATQAYQEFLLLGGTVRTAPLDETLITETLSEETPILCGLSATYLYQESRELAGKSDQGHVSTPDDIGGDPTGHFVVLHGYNPVERLIQIADPLHPNPMAMTHNYTASLSRVTSAILLGIVTYDANLLTIQPKSSHAPRAMPTHQSHRPRSVRRR